jgi:hypothetical protein
MKNVKLSTNARGMEAVWTLTWESPLPVPGDMGHGRGIYTAKNKKMARVYKKHAKSKGLPSYLHEVDIPEDENLLDEEKYYEHRPQ